MEVPRDSAAAAAAMARLQDLIADPEGRERFLADPKATLDRAEVQTEDIPEPVLDVLKSMSPEELELVARLQTTLAENGLSIHVAGGGSVAFF